MKLFLNINFILMALLLSSAIAAFSLEEQQQEEVDYELTETTSEDQFGPEEYEFSGRSLLQKKIKTKRLILTCNKYPTMCHRKGSRGPHCCKKKCVNLLTDRHNCGTCGKKCKYNMICCNGKCVNPSFDRRHCGSCNNRCKAGEFCAFGLCNYA